MGAAMITRVINGVKCRMIEGSQKAAEGDWYVGAYASKGEFIEPAHGCIGATAEWFNEHSSARIFRPIKRATKPKATASGIEAMVCADIAERQKNGIAKYKMTVIDNPGDLKYFMNHFYEELLDAAVYAKRAISDLDKIIANMEAKGR